MLKTKLWDFQYCMECASKELKLMNQTVKPLTPQKELSQSQGKRKKATSFFKDANGQRPKRNVEKITDQSNECAPLSNSVYPMPVEKPEALHNLQNLNNGD